MRSHRFFLSVILLTAVGALTAHADTTVYSTGFEPPTFTVGDINGQGGWTVFADYPGSSDISTVLPQTGLQSVFVNGARGAVQSGPYHSDTAVGPTVELSAALAIFSGTTQSAWQFAALGPGLAGFLGGIDIYPDNTIHAITAGLPDIGTWTRASSFNASAYHEVNLFFNLMSQTYSIVVDGVTLDSNIPFCGDNGACTSGAVLSYGNGLFDSFGVAPIATDSAYMDNYSVIDVNAVPEPATAIPVLCALTTAAVFALRRRSSRRHSSAKTSEY